MVAFLKISEALTAQEDAAADSAAAAYADSWGRETPAGSELSDTPAEVGDPSTSGWPEMQVRSGLYKLGSNVLLLKRFTSPGQFALFCSVRMIVAVVMSSEICLPVASVRWHSLPISCSKCKAKAPHNGDAVFGLAQHDSVQLAYVFMSFLPVQRSNCFRFNNFLVPDVRRRWRGCTCMHRCYLFGLPDVQRHWTDSCSASSMVRQCLWASRFAGFVSSTRATAIVLL